MSPRTVAVRLLVVAGFEARDVGLHHTGAHYHEGVGTASAAALPFIERQLLDVGDKIRLPDSTAVEFCLGGKVVRLPGISVVEVVEIIEDKVLAGPLTQQLRQVGHRKPARASCEAGVEELMPSVGWQDKVAARAPLKSLLCSLVPPDRRGAVSGDNIGRLGVHMPQRR